MIVFFDASVHVGILRGVLLPDAVLARAEGGPVRLSPVVAGELLRGTTGKGRRAVEKLVRRVQELGDCAPLDSCTPSRYRPRATLY